MTKLSDLSALTGATVVPADDLIHVADMSETGVARSKKMTFAELLIGVGAMPLSYLDTDDTLAADSDVKVPSQQAVKAYVAAAVTGLLDLKGSTDTSANPNYPAASKGDTYIVSVAGKIGGASGTVVEVGDVYVASADNAGGDQATVGTSWMVLQGNILSGAAVTFATASDINTGTDTTKALNSDALAGSNFGKAVITLLVSDPAGSAITTGDGKAYWPVPSTLNGMNLVAVAAYLTTVSSSGIPTVQIHNLTQTADMLTTKLTIDASELTSATAAAAAVIDTGNDDVATGDILRIDIDVAGTGAKGLMVEMQFQLP